VYAGIETGGTKTVCAVGADGRIVDRAQFPTGFDPQQLIRRCVDFFAAHDVVAAGIGTFGPCDPDPQSPTYGRILATPKPGWQGVDIRGRLQEALGVAVTLTTDVTAAAWGELHLGAGRGLQDLVYLTIGTGVGAGVVAGGRPLHGAQHPEIGHMLVPGSTADGVCPYHGGCVEGLASGPAMQARFGVPATELGDDDPAWDEEAAIVASALHNVICALSPQMIVIGGGVGARQGLHRRLPALVERSLAGYVALPRLTAPALGPDSGVAGALLLAQTAT
jgi:fructokinase